jgi:pyrroline-5-carboxylate reductase
VQIEGTIAFVGSGAMAEAIIRSLVHQEVVDPQQIVASDPRQSRRDYMTESYGVRTSNSNLEAIKEAGIVVLCVKPQVLAKVLNELSGLLAPDVLVISIVAGARISLLRNGLSHTRIVRSMPNTPAQVGKGMTVWTATPAVTDQNKRDAQTILGVMGDAIYVEEEHYLDMATGLSGSGPGFVFLFIEALIDAGVQIGFSRSVAERMVLQTIEGSVAIMRQTGSHPADLRNRVTSPGGTTAAGIHEMEKRGFRAAVSEAIIAAYLRSKELGDMSERDMGR